MAAYVKNIIGLDKGVNVIFFLIYRVGDFGIPITSLSVLVRDKTAVIEKIKH